jgi:hypothetical protein
MLNVNVKEQWWKKCTIVVNKLSSRVHNIEHDFSDDGR